MEGRWSARSVAGASGDTGSPPAVAGASGSPPPAVAGASGSPPPAMAGGGGSASSTTSENVSTTILGLMESELAVSIDDEAELMSSASLASVSMPSVSLPPAAGDSEETGSPPPTQNIRDDENTNVNSSLTDNEANVNSSLTDNEAELLSSASLSSVSMPSASLPSAAGDSEERGSPPPTQNGVTDSDTVRMPSVSVPSLAPTSSVSLPFSMVGDIEDTGSPPPAQNNFISDRETASGSGYHISGPPSPFSGYHISGPPPPVSLFGGEAVLVSPTSSTSSSEDTGGGHEHRS